MNKMCCNITAHWRNVWSTCYFIWNCSWMGKHNQEWLGRDRKLTTQWIPNNGKRRVLRGAGEICSWTCMQYSCTAIAADIVISHTRSSQTRIGNNKFVAKWIPHVLTSDQKTMQAFSSPPICSTGKWRQCILGPHFNCWQVMDVDLILRWNGRMLNHVLQRHW